MAVIYRCDVCGTETRAYRSLTFKRSVIAHGQVTAPEAILSLDVCSNECELQAATELLQKLSKASSVDEQGRPFRAPPPVQADPDPGPPPASPPFQTWDQIANARR
jgi:hypothetical protein